MELAEYVKYIRTEKGLSLKNVEQRSGDRITNGYISQIENGAVLASSVSVEKLKALAKGLGVPENDLFRIARGLPETVPDRYAMYADRFDAHGLDVTEWQFLETYFNDYVRAYIDGKKAREEEIMRMSAERFRETSFPDTVKKAPVLARISGPEPRTITPEEEDEIARRVNKRKAG